MSVQINMPIAVRFRVIDKRDLSIVACMAWNYLSDFVRLRGNQSIFKRKLETHLFTIAFAALNF
jgi:hypothetical protein